MYSETRQLKTASRKGREGKGTEETTEIFCFVFVNRPTSLHFTSLHFTKGGKRNDIKLLQ